MCLRSRGPLPGRGRVPTFPTTAPVFHIPHQRLYDALGRTSSGGGGKAMAAYTTTYINHVKLFVDGGCRGNPGPGAVGVLVVNASGNVDLDLQATCIGTTTCNGAEYQAVITGLNVCARYTRGRVTCFTDSRSEERRVGEECRSRWSPDHLKKKKKNIMACQLLEQITDTIPSESSSTDPICTRIFIII